MKLNALTGAIVPRASPKKGKDTLMTSFFWDNIAKSINSIPPVRMS